MQNIKNSVSALLVGVVLAFVGASLALSPEVGAVDVLQNCSGSEICKVKTENIEKDGTVQNLTNLFLYLLGIIAVIAIIYGGITYVTSNGAASKIKKAKDVILYAVIGVVVGVMAWGIVNFVLNQF